MSTRIAGVAAQNVATPSSLEELRDTVRELHALRRPFAFVGGATHLELGNAPRALDTVVRTAALDRIVEYAPEDQTITLECGVTFAELDRTLAGHGQMFPLDVADREHATIGGAVAVNASGRRRQRYGTIKDLIVGVTMVRPDGVLARGGGKVVKNVAGFDLPKLVVGSLGTLGAIGAVTLRVYPIPEAVRAVRIPFEKTDRLAQALRELIARRLEPESVVLYDYSALVLTFAGTAAGVDAQLATAREIAHAAGADTPEELSPLQREGCEQRERAVRRDGEWRLRIAAAPSHAVAQLGAFVGAPPVAVPVAYPALGIALHAYASDFVPEHRAAGPDGHLDELRAHVAAQTGGAGTVVVDAMPDGARPQVDAWGPTPPSFALMRTLKHRFDPAGLCNPGRFVGGL